MGPENPPRRSKPDQEPLTIDLAANAAAAKDAAAGETAILHEPPVDATSGDAPFSERTEAFHEEKPGADEKTVTDEIPLTPESGSDDDTRAEDAASAFAEEPATSKAEPIRSPYAEPPRTSNTGALAAGIVGGLITLLGAGGLQYAGILPSFGPATGGNGTAVTDSLAGEIEAIKSQLANTTAVSGGADIASIETRLAALEKTAADASTGTAANLSGLEAEVANLTGEIATLKTALADTRQTTETAKTELSTRIDAAEKKIDEPASDVQLARAIAVTALKTSIDRGGPFLAELDALKSIAPNDPAVTGLSGDAATGVTSRADLTRDFPQTADAMLEATRHSDPNQGVFARLMDSASSAIRVRTVGSVEGDGPDAIIARIEDKLANGDLKGASLEWDALPEPAKTAGADFRTRLDQRIRVEALIDATVAGAMTANQG